jgi:hypothetical protein
MNKRINELAQKAEDYADDTDLPWLATYTEKFAELLIRDCRDMFVADSPSWNLLNEKLGVRDGK